VPVDTICRVVFLPLNFNLSTLNLKMPTGTAKIFKNGANNTCLKKITEKLSGNNRKINRAITGKIFLPCKILPQLVVF